MQNLKIEGTNEDIEDMYEYLSAMEPKLDIEPMFINSPDIHREPLMTSIFITIAPPLITGIFSLIKGYMDNKHEENMAKLEITYMDDEGNNRKIDYTEIERIVKNKD